MNIGSDPHTRIAYPASGSFMDYLIITYGLSTVKLGHRTVSGKKKEGEDPWNKIFQEPLESLEKKWLRCVYKKYNQDVRIVEEYFDKR